MSDTWEYRVTKAGGIEIWRHTAHWLSNDTLERRAGMEIWRRGEQTLHTHSERVVAIPAEAIRQAVANVEPGVGWRREDARGTFDPEDMA